MKHIWEEKDVICGRWVYSFASLSAKEQEFHFRENYTPTRLYQLGYIGGSSKNGMVLISTVDGMVCNEKGCSKKEMMDRLNTVPMIPIIITSQIQEL